MQLALIHPKALEAIRSFPKAARHDLGEATLDLQYGARLSMPLSRPMPSVGAGVHELRVRDSSGIDQAFYAVKSGTRRTRAARI
jgi:phage-related protein